MFASIAQTLRGENIPDNKNVFTKQTLLLLGMLLIRFIFHELGEDFGFYAFIIITYILAYFFLKTLPKESRLLHHYTWPKKKIVVICCLIGLLCLVFQGVFDYYYMGMEFHSFRNNFAKFMQISTYPFFVIVKIFLNALPEELLFRGFLWGYLRRLKFSNLSILLIQAFLFWIGHYFHYFNFGAEVWLSTLVMALIFGVVAWKTKSLFMSAIVHAFVNSISAWINVS